MHHHLADRQTDRQTDTQRHTLESVKLVLHHFPQTFEKVKEGREHIIKKKENTFYREHIPRKEENTFQREHILKREDNTF